MALLGGLDVDACRHLVEDLLDADELPAPIVGRVLDAGDGNPLFLRELVRMLVDDGVLRRDGDRWVATVEATGVELPVTINAVLAARIEQLGSGERAVLETAAIVGRHFARGAVGALVASSVAARLDEHLDALRRRELIDPDFSMWGDEPMYRFHHVLIQDAAYRRVLKEVRAELHQRYAEWLADRLGGETIEYDEILGWHYEQAHRYRAELSLDDVQIVPGEPRRTWQPPAVGRFNVTTCRRRQTCLSAPARCSPTVTSSALRC